MEGIFMWSMNISANEEKSNTKIKSGIQTEKYKYFNTFLAHLEI